jgi:hypothetical protein
MTLKAPCTELIIIQIGPFSPNLNGLHNINGGKRRENHSPQKASKLSNTQEVHEYYSIKLYLF